MTEVAPENPLYSVRTVANMMDVTTHTVRQWIEKKKLPAVKIEGKWRVQKSDLNTFVNKEYGDASAQSH